MRYPLDVLFGLLGRDADELIPICSQVPGATGLMVDWVRADSAGEFCETLAGERHVWFGVQPTGRPEKGRGTSKNVTGLVALYCDIDFADGKSGGMGVERHEALSVIAGLTEALGGVGPHAIVQSGYGLQPYWAIERCDQVDGALLLIRWKQVVKAVCDQFEIKLDMGVYDLPRILRVPGPPNLKHDTSAPTGLVVKHQDKPIALDAAHDAINAWFERQGIGSSANPLSDREGMRRLMDNPGARQNRTENGTQLPDERVFTDEQAQAFLEEHAWRPARETPWGAGADYWKVLWQCAMVASHFSDMYDEEDLRERLREAVREGHGADPDARDEYQIELGFMKGTDWYARRPTEQEQLNPFSNHRDTQRIAEKQGGIRAASPGGGSRADGEDVGALEFEIVDANGVIVSSSDDRVATGVCPFSGAPVISAGNLAKNGASSQVSDDTAAREDAVTVSSPGDTVVDGSRRRLSLQSAGSMKMRSSNWLWKHGSEHWIPIGGLVLLGGREGVGKSTWTARLIAQVTRGAMEGEFLGKPKGVIMCATEDAWEQTILPRLAAAGADLNKIWRVDAQVNETTMGSVSLPEDIVALTKAIEALDVALVVLDPLMGTIPSGLDSHKDQDVRIALEPISRLAADSNVTVIGLIHQNKSQSGDLLTRLMGSRAFSAVARTVLVCAEADAREGDGESANLFDGETKAPRQFLFGQLKNNLAARVETSVRYEIEGKLAGHEEETGREVWSSKIKTVDYADPTGVEDAVTAREKSTKASKAKGTEQIPVDPELSLTKVQQAMQFIADNMATLPEGWLASNAVSTLESAGFSHGTYTSARSKLGIVSMRHEKGWMWRYRD